MSFLVAHTFNLVDQSAQRDLIRSKMDDQHVWLLFNYDTRSNDAIKGLKVCFYPIFVKITKSDFFTFIVKCNPACLDLLSLPFVLSRLTFALFLTHATDPTRRHHAATHRCLALDLPHFFLHSTIRFLQLTSLRRFLASCSSPFISVMLSS